MPDEGGAEFFKYQFYCRKITEFFLEFLFVTTTLFFGIRVVVVWGKFRAYGDRLISVTVHYNLCFHVEGWMKSNIFLLSRAWKYENLKPKSLRRRWRRSWSSSCSSSSSSSSCSSSCTGTPKSPSQEWGTGVIQEEKKLSNNKNMSGSDIKIKKVLVLKRVDLMSCWSF